MSGFADWLFFIGGGLAIVFMSWVLSKFTEQLAGSERAARRADGETEAVYVVEAGAAPQRSRVPERGY